MPKYTYNEIVDRTMYSHKMFYHIEGYVNDFLDYVPFDYSHLEVYSLKLVTIILETGPELINSFDLAVAETNFGIRALADPQMVQDREDLWKKERQLRSRNRSLTFNGYYGFLEKHEIPKLSTAMIKLEGSDAYTMPFEELHPKWWENYNLLKHDKYNNLKVATLRTALKASGALFWLVDRNSRMFHLEKPFSSRLFQMIDSRDLTSSSQKL